MLFLLRRGRAFLRCRSCGRLRLGDLQLSHRNEQNPRIGWSSRTVDILQLFLAETKGLKPLRRHLEGVHQHIPDRIGAPLAQDQIVVAPAGGFDMVAEKSSDIIASALAN